MPRPAIRAALLGALIALPAPAAAGAWLKEKGGKYLAFSLDGGSADIWTGVYAEWGIAETMTVGLAAGRNRDSDRALLFTRRAVPERIGAVLTDRIGGRLAYELGGGVVDGDPAASVTLSWGRAISTRWGDGWANVDVTGIAVHRPVLEAEAYDPYAYVIERKLDAVIGLRRTPRSTWQLAAFAWSDGEDSSLAIVPSYARDFGLAELRIGLRLGTETGLSFGLSRSF